MRRPAAADLRDVFEDLKPFSERVNVAVANVPGQEYSDPRVQPKIRTQNSPLRLNPGAREFKSW